MSDPIYPKAVWQEGTLQNDVPANDNSLRDEALAREVVAIANSPTTPDDGDVYIVGAAPTGAFSTFDPDDITIFRGGAWYAWAPIDGLQANGYHYTGSGGWVPGGGGGGAVSSVNGQTGVVSLALDDLTDVSAAAPTTTYVLTWNGSAWVPAAPGGGGGLTNWAEAYGAGTQATSSFTATNAATNVNAALIAKGTGATTAQVPDGTTAGGNARGTYATDWQKSRNDAPKVASGNYSTIAGGNGNTTSGAYAFAVGDSNTASAGTSSAIGSGNTASGTYAAAIGYAGSSGGTASLTVNYNCGASGNYSFSGGYFSTTTGEAAFSFGQQCSASGPYSQAMGDNCTSNADYSAASGRGATSDGVIGASARASYRFSVNGDAQRREFVLCSDTTNATQEPVSTNNATAAANNQVTLRNDSAFLVKGLVVARENSTGDSKSWEFTAHIKRGANASATALVAAATVTTIAADSGASAWALAVTANTTLGCLAIGVTGEASKTIRWLTHVYSCAEVVG